jgi:hypothetical protein
MQHFRVSVSNMNVPSCVLLIFSFKDRKCCYQYGHEPQNGFSTPLAIRPFTNYIFSPLSFLFRIKGQKSSSVQSPQTLTACRLSIIEIAFAPALLAICSCTDEPSRNSAVGVATGYGLGGQGVGVPAPVGA